jgi:hypothetical protein
MPIGKAPAELKGYLAPYPKDVQRAMTEGRVALAALVGPASELIYDATSAVCDGFSYTGGVRGIFVNLAAFKDHVTLVFGYGANLDDPDSRLSGGGKQVRHVRLRSAADLADPAIVALVRQSAEQAPRPEAAIEPSVVTKAYAGPKRRPSPAARRHRGG